MSRLDSQLQGGYDCSNNHIPPRGHAMIRSVVKLFPCSAGGSGGNLPPFLQDRHWIPAKATWPISIISLPVIILDDAESICTLTTKKEFVCLDYRGWTYIMKLVFRPFAH